MSILYKFSSNDLLNSIYSIYKYIGETLLKCVAYTSQHLYGRVLCRKTQCSPIYNMLVMFRIHSVPHLRIEHANTIAHIVYKFQRICHRFVFRVLNSFCVWQKRHRIYNGKITQLIWRLFCLLNSQYRFQYMYTNANLNLVGLLDVYIFIFGDFSVWMFSHIYVHMCINQCAMSERGATHKFAFLAYTAHKTTHSRCYIWTLKLHTHTHTYI